MRALHPDLRAHLDGGVTTLCRCWRLTRSDGFVLGFTDHDRTVVFDGTSFEPDAGAAGSALAASADLAVDNAEFDGALTSERLTAGDLSAGRYDGARIEIFCVNWAAPDQRLLLKVGRIGDVSREGGRFVAEIRGLTAALDQPTGRIYQRSCDARLGDARCGVDASNPAWRGVGAVAAVIDDGRFIAIGLESYASGWFADGALEWTSGANAGLGGHVKTFGPAAGGASVALWRPAGAPVTAGDAFTVTAGCDRTAATCAGKFSNIVNFRGFHLMPGNDFAVSYPLRGEANAGGRRS